MNAAIYVAGWTLVHFAWQGALVGLAAAFALRLLRHAAPQSRQATTFWLRQDSTRSCISTSR